MYNNSQRPKMIKIKYIYWEIDGETNLPPTCQTLAKRSFIYLFQEDTCVDLSSNFEGQGQPWWMFYTIVQQETETEVIASFWVSQTLCLKL